MRTFNNAFFADGICAGRQSDISFSVIKLNWTYPTTMRGLFFSTSILGFTLSRPAQALIVDIVLGFASLVSGVSDPPATIRRASSAHAEMTRACGGKQY